MPYCCQCGTAVGNTDRFCGKCGAPQAPPHSAPGASTFNAGTAGQRPSDFMGGMSHRTAAILCYIPVVGWIAAIIVLASDRFRTDNQIRFHAFQGLYLFVAWLLVSWVVSPALHVMGPFHSFGSLLHLAIFVACIVMIVKVSHNENYRLPIVGELADRSVSEQRS